MSPLPPKPLPKKQSSYGNYQFCPPGCSIDYRDCYQKSGVKRVWHECECKCTNSAKSNLPSTPLTTFHLYLIHLDTFYLSSRDICTLWDILSSLHNFKGLLQAWFYSAGWNSLRLLFGKNGDGYVYSKGWGNALWSMRGTCVCALCVGMFKHVSHRLCPHCQQVSPGLADSSEGQTKRKTDGQHKQVSAGQRMT